MPLNTGDHLEVVWHQDFLGNEVLNAQWYECGSTDPDISMEDVANAALSHFTNTAQQVQAAVVTLNRVKVTNHDTLEEFELVVSPPTNGQVNVNSCPPTVTYSIKQVRSLTITRNGRKGVAGVAESNQDNGNVTLSSTAIGLLEDFAREHVAVDAGGGSDFDLLPIIVGRTLVPLSNPPQYDLDFTKINPIVNAVLNPHTGTQNSRQYGHGS